MNKLGTFINETNFLRKDKLRDNKIDHLYLFLFVKSAVLIKLQFCEIRSISKDPSVL